MDDGVWRPPLVHEIDKGSYSETCSFRDICTYMHGIIDISKNRDHLKVFYTPAYPWDCSKFERQIQFDVIGLLRDVKFGSDSILLQFWARGDFQKGNFNVLKTAAPFGLGHYYKGLCRYRNRCLSHGYIVDGSGSEDSQLGPPGRVFRKGSPEFCPNIEAYSSLEFPLRDYAIHECGIRGYWALPLFHPDQQLCVGVLEFAAFNCAAEALQEVNPVLLALKEGNLWFESFQSSELHRSSYTIVEEEFSVEYSQSDKKFKFFDVCPNRGNLSRQAILENGRGDLHPLPIVEANATNDKINATVIERFPGGATHSKTQDRVETSKACEGVYTNAEARITLDVLRPHFGRNLGDAAESLGVSRSTLKRICRSRGIHRWPSHKRKNVGQIYSSSRLPKERCHNINAPEKNAVASTPTSENGQSMALKDEVDKHTMTVKATHSENMVKFPLCCNSIERLNQKIAERFKLEVGRFTIKYEDEDGDWIMISCDEDLCYHAETLKSSEQSIMKLSVFPVTQ